MLMIIGFISLAIFFNTTMVQYVIKYIKKDDFYIPGGQSEIKTMIYYILYKLYYQHLMEINIAISTHDVAEIEKYNRFFFNIQMLEAAILTNNIDVMKCVMAKCSYNTKCKVLDNPNLISLEYIKCFDTLEDVYYYVETLTFDHFIDKLAQDDVIYLYEKLQLP